MMSDSGLLTWLAWVNKKIQTTGSNKSEILCAIIGTASFAAVKPDNMVPEKSTLGELRAKYHVARPMITGRNEAADELLTFAIHQLHGQDAAMANRLCDDLLAAPIMPELAARLQILQHGFGLLDQRMSPAEKAEMLKLASDVITRQQSKPVRGGHLRDLQGVYATEVLVLAA